MTKFKGGKELEKLAKKAKVKEGSISYSVGFFPKAKYGDGTQVALVGLWQEFGTRAADGSVLVPERPFFRSTRKPFQKEIRRLTIKLRNPQTKLMDKKSVGKIAEVHVGVIKEKIQAIKSPPNAPETIARKKSANPLIDTGLMFQSVTWELN